jgi:prepilin-type processing-associated H-X9-DG protein
VMVGEYATRTHNSRRTFWAYTYTSYNQSSTMAQARMLWNDFDLCQATAGPGGTNACKRAFGSFHPGGINFAFGDGSVRTISRNVDLVMYAALGSCAGGETVSLDF